MRLYDLFEASPDTPEGSFSRDLILSKEWLCRTLKNFDLVSYDNIYILGSWYGAMSFVILKSNITFDQIFNVERDPKKCIWLDRALKAKHLENKIHATNEDCNNIDYMGSHILVINTSTNDIEGQGWLENIPPGSVVALQGRDQQEGSNGINTLNKFDEAYQLQETFFCRSLQLHPKNDEPYHRFMKIGIK